MYSWIKYAIISSRSNQPEYIVRRLKKERRATITNAKIRLSDLNLNNLIQTLRGQSKWLKN